MAAKVTIGEFSVMTRLTRKALRLYHDAGVLEPTEVDGATGYRFYDLSQLDRARTIKRLRDLHLPIAEVKSYIGASNDAARQRILRSHLARLEDQLRQTSDDVALLRSLIDVAGQPTIEERVDPAFVAVVLTDIVRLSDVASWWNAGRDTLQSALESAGTVATGPMGADFDQAFFVEERGTVSLWYPIGATESDVRGVDVVTMPSARYAVAVHEGPDARIDETSAALGAYVAARGTGISGPIRERYLAGVDSEHELVTEIGWPIVST